MAIRPFTLTTAAGLSLLLALQADAGQANVSLATGSAATTANAAITPSLTDAATSAAAVTLLEAQPPPPATPAPAAAPAPAPSVTGGVNVDLFSHYVWRGFVLTDRLAFEPSASVSTHGLNLPWQPGWSR